MLRTYFITVLFTGCALAAGSAMCQEETFYYLFPDWSPDGQKIAFESGFEGQGNIYIINVDGTNLRQLTDETYNDERPIWSPDGTKIAFFSNRSEKRNEQPISLQIYIMNADGSGQRRITPEGPALEYNISWSPDGKQLVFQSRPEINPGVHSLYIIGVDGSGRERITDGRHNDTDPQWSPDGDKILFIQSDAIYKFFEDYTPEDRVRRQTSAEVAVLNLKDRSIDLLTDNNIREFDPSWSSDGKEILYLQENGEDRTFFGRRLGEKDAIPLADGNSVSNKSFGTRTRLSPDGRYLVYHKEVGGKWGLYIFDLETKKEKLLIGGDQGK